jgi:hypothetical protein
MNAKRILAALALAVALLATRPLSALAGAVTDANVSQMMASAKAPADYQALADFFTAQAADAAAKVKSHEAMLASVKAGGGKGSENFAPHCATLISSYKEAQKQYEALAAQYAAAAK